MKHINWRGILARLPLPMLALSASYGVYSFALLFVPQWVAVVQAAAFELTYIGLAVTQGLDTAQRKRATGISLGAVATSIIYNTLAGWFHTQSGLLDVASPIAWLCLAILHGAPLAWVAFLVANLLLHTEQQAPVSAPLRPAIASETPKETVYATINTDGVAGNSSNTSQAPTRDYSCRHCGATGLTKSEQLAHGRQHKREAVAVE